MRLATQLVHQGVSENQHRASKVRVEGGGARDRGTGRNLSVFSQFLDRSFGRTTEFITRVNRYRFVKDTK